MGSESAETELIERARARDGEAWRQLYETHNRALYRHARYLLGDPGGAEELVQQVFVQAALCIARFDGRSSLQSWLHGIAINLVRSHRRRRRNQEVAMERLRAIEDLVDRSGPSPDVSLLRQQQSAMLFAALEELPDSLREAFVLRDLEGLSPEEAAQRLEITSGNLRVRATRARARLREVLTQMRDDDGRASA